MYRKFEKFVWTVVVCARASSSRLSQSPIGNQGGPYHAAGTYVCYRRGLVGLCSSVRLSRAITSATPRAAGCDCNRSTDGYKSSLLTILHMRSQARSSRGVCIARVCIPPGSGIPVGMWQFDLNGASQPLAQACVCLSKGGYIFLTN